MEVPSCKYQVLLEDEFQKQSLFARNSQVPFFSSLTGTIVGKTETLDPRFWVSSLVSPVLFSSAIMNITPLLPRRMFLEIGPHSILAAPIRDICLDEHTHLMYASAMTRNHNGESSILHAIGSLYQHGTILDYTKLFPSGKILSDLPTYPWDHEASFWYESRVSKDWRFRKYGYHGLLGLRILETTDIDPCWRNLLDVEDEPWLRDHKIQNNVVFPFAGYCAIAGEALRQISGNETGYCLENIKARSALILDESGANEIVTALRSCQLSDPSGTNAWMFTISSRSGSSWVVNCEGVVKPGRTRKPAAPRKDACLRALQPSRFYEAFADVGVHLGPTFQRLTSVMCSATAHLARGKIGSPAFDKDQTYALHPCAIDACLQLILIAKVRGLCRNLTDLTMPTLIEGIEVTQGPSEMEAIAWSPDENGSIGLECRAGGMEVMRLSGMHVTTIDGNEEPKAASMSARLEWRPCLDFVDHSTLFTPPPFRRDKTALQEEMTWLCIVDSLQTLEGLIAKQPHFNKYLAWLFRQVSEVQSSKDPLLQGSRDALQLSRVAKAQMIEARCNEILSMSKNDPVTECTWRIWRNVEDIFTGRAEALDILMQDNLLTDLYSNYSFDHSRIVQLLAHKSPTLRILEVGAGTGGTTQTFLHELIDPDGNPMYSLYTFSDISAGFFPRARERFVTAPNMDFRIFDISRGPLEQGFEAQTYDLILAANVVHATPVLQDTLRNLKVLLRPDGYLIMTELAGSLRANNYLFGCLPGWWLGEGDARSETPSVAVERWDQELKSAAFTGVDTVVYDAPAPYQSCAVMVTRPQLMVEKIRRDRPVVIICENPDCSIATTLLKALLDASYRVSVSTLGESMPTDSDIVSILDLESGVLEDISSSKFFTLQNFIRDHSSPKMLWLTLPSQIYCKDPSAAQFIGLARTIRSELAAPLFTLELESSEPEFGMLTVQLLGHIRAGPDNEKSPDYEFALYREKIHVGRYHPVQLAKASRGHGDHGSLENISRYADAMPSQPIGQSSESVLKDHAGVDVLASTDDLNVSELPRPKDIPYVSNDLNDHRLSASLTCHSNSGRITEITNHSGQQPLDINTPPERQNLSLHSEAAYVLTGGLGGLGRSIATWLIERGARALMFLSRSASSKFEDSKFSEELQSLGCSVFAISGEVQNGKDVQRAVSAPGRTIKGVIHLAGILRVGLTFRSTSALSLTTSRTLLT